MVHGGVQPGRPPFSEAEEGLAGTLDSCWGIELPRTRGKAITEEHDIS
jgi:hypothetical protein